MNKNLDEKEVEYNDFTGEYTSYGKVMNLFPHLGEHTYKDLGGTYCILTDKECKVDTYDETKYLVDGIFLIGGAEYDGDFNTHPNESIGVLGFYKDNIDYNYLTVPYKAKGKYNWNINDNIDGCVVKKDESEPSDIVKETLSGVFYIDEEYAVELGLEGYKAQSTVLEPFNKKDLKMRDY